MKGRGAFPVPIGELSRRTGVNIETIRYYERIGMLPVALRGDNGRRTYRLDDQWTLKFVRRARELGFTLEEIRALLALRGQHAIPCGDVKAIANTHLSSVRAKLADLARLEAILAATVAKCAGETAPVCPVLDMLDTDACADGAPCQSTDEPKPVAPAP